MMEHTIGTREQWLTARRELLRREKEHTRLGDELARRRREHFDSHARGWELELGELVAHAAGRAQESAER